MPDNDWCKDADDFKEPLLSRNVELANLLTEIGFPHNVSAGVVAAAIVGSRDQHQIEDMLPAAEFVLSDTELEQINQYVSSTHNCGDSDQHQKALHP